MVIQRIQSLLLLIATVLIGLMFIVPIAVFNDPAVTVTILDCGFPVLYILDGLIGLLLLIDIFLFKNLRLQMLVASVCALLMCGLAGVYAAWVNQVYNNPLIHNFKPMYLIGGAMLAVAFVLTLWARSRMRHDHNLLRSADRLR